jgi:malate dehydrogenase (oxaloacetate-decarboxylating)
VLGFPGLFKGALAANAKSFTDPMLVAAAKSIADQAPGDDLVPDPLNLDVHQLVATAVAAAV